VKPAARHDLSLDKYPVTLRLISGTTGAIIWEHVVTAEEARSFARVEIPSFAGTEHYPVRAEITYADGTTDIGGLQ
jgi:hypothetical protein